jgi:hypothetical protein
MRELGLKYNNDKVIHHRYDIINKIIYDNNFEHYLEIGVRHPEDCFDKINVKNKHSVDPGFENEQNNVTYPFTSDDFFRRLQNGFLDIDSSYEWDVIFIDGLHISDQVEKDIFNSLNHLSKNGFILLHDCNPFLYEYNHIRVVEDYWGQAWNGTVWKVIYKLLCFRKDLQIYTINTDEGVSVIKRGNRNKLVEFINPYFEYKVFYKNLNEHLNLIDVNDINKIYE